MLKRPRNSPQGGPPSGQVLPGPAPQKAGLDSAQAESSDLFDYALLRDYLLFGVRALLRHKLLAASSFSAVVLLAALSLWVFPKTYRVEARILAQRNQVIGVISNPALLRPAEIDAPTSAARETVLRWDNLVFLVEQTDLVENYLRTISPLGKVRRAVMKVLRGREPTHDEMVEDLAHTLEARLKVDVWEGIVRIVVHWSDPHIAYQLANAALQNFMDVRHSSEISIMSDAVAILESHSAAVQNEIASVTERINELDRNARSPSRTPRRSIAPRRQSGQESELGRLQALLNGKKASIAYLEEARHRRMAEAQDQLEQARAVYSDRHPAVLSLRDTIAALSRPSPQIDTLRTQVRELEREIADAEGARSFGDAPSASLAAARDVSAPVGGGDPGHPQLDGERARLRVLFNKYWTFQDRMEMARLEMDTSKAAFKYRYSVILPPQIPKQPFTPKPALFWAAGLAGGLLFALFAAVATDLRSGIIAESWQIRRWLDLPVLTEVSK